jgi:hypothetical protein
MASDSVRDSAQPYRGHSRSRSGKGSNDSTRPYGSQKASSQKAMLSRALQKANTAVQLDNAQNFEGARQAYHEACDLLQHVLQRTTADEDKRKLEAIRRTYTSRIDELDQMAPYHDVHSKALPARPGSVDHRQSSGPQQDDEDPEEEPVIIETASVTRLTKPEAQGYQPFQPSSRPSLMVHTSGQGLLQSAFSKSPVRGKSPIDLTTAKPSDKHSDLDYQRTIPPLSPHRSLSPPSIPTDPIRLPVQGNSAEPVASQWQSKPTSGHTREDSQNSWLDPIDESDGSTSPSVHSRTSSLGYRRRRLRPGSGATELEFDTALDAAIEAAYDEGYEPMDAGHTDHTDHSDADNQIVANALRKVELARERVRQTEREAYGFEDELDMVRQPQQQPKQMQPTGTLHSPEDFFDDNSSEEEELLENMIQQYVAGKAASNQLADPYSAAKHTSGSSASRAGSSSGPNSQANHTRAIAEGTSNQHSSLSSGSPPKPMQTVRNRRLSGQNLKQLKIETTMSRPAQASAYPGDRNAESEQMASLAASGRPSSPLEDISPTDTRPLESPFGATANMEDYSIARASSPTMEKLQQHISSSSLKQAKERSMSTSNLDDGSDLSPGTPSSQYFANSRTPGIPSLPTPLTTTFRDNMEATSAGGMFLFDDNFHSPVSPGSPNPLSLDAPVSLEPCPTDFMLRPFWLMRCLFQTLVHPRGGYLSTKLFVPREVWRVKGVKLRNVEDKISNCDYLTAALLKLAKVDTYDADAVLEEMQSLEGVLEEVQASLVRRLGTEVGVQASGALFKETGGTAEGSPPTSVPRSASVSAKSSSSSFSWRRLRSKNSAAGLANLNGNRAMASSTAIDVPKDLADLPTLPMTPTPTSRPAKRDLSQVQFTGPNAHYMGSLARLFDAAQVIDQIARQVEDPGLRHADKTQVGLELCTRHAAEFFAFYICRFALGDLNILLEKFLKRGSEWVLI